MKIVEHCVNFKYLHVFALWSDDSNFTLFLVRIETVSFSRVQQCYDYYYYYKQMPGIVACLEHQREISEYEHACNILQLVPSPLFARTHVRTYVRVFMWQWIYWPYMYDRTFRLYVYQYHNNIYDTQLFRYNFDIVLCPYCVIYERCQQYL